MACRRDEPEPQAPGRQVPADSGHRKDAPGGRLADEQDRSTDRHADHAQNGGRGQGHRPGPSHRIRVVVRSGPASRRAGLVVDFALAVHGAHGSGDDQSGRTRPTDEWPQNCGVPEGDTVWRRAVGCMRCSQVAG